MYLLAIFIIFCLLAYFFNKWKNQKLKRTSKTTINLFGESILQVITSYILVIISLTFAKGMTYIHIFKSLFESRLRFLIKFSAITFIYLAVILLLSLLLKTEIKHSTEKKKKPYIFSFIFTFLVAQFLMFALYMRNMFPYLDIEELLFVLSMPVKGTSHIIVISDSSLFLYFSSSLTKNKHYFCLHYV